MLLSKKKQYKGGDYFIREKGSGYEKNNQNY